MSTKEDKLKNADKERLTNFVNSTYMTDNVKIQNLISLLYSKLTPTMKKYDAILVLKGSTAIRMLHNNLIEIFPKDNRYQHYEDTALGEYSHLDHKDDKRRKLYYNRFSNTDTKKDALLKEFKNSKGKINAKILSHLFLW